MQQQVVQPQVQEELIRMAEPLKVEVAFKVEYKDLYLDIMEFKYDMIEKYGMVCIQGTEETKLQ